MANTDLAKRAQALDAQDPLSHLIKEFALPHDCIYLDGNSLGPLPIKAKHRAREVVEQQWGEDLITSWNKHQWIDLPSRVGAKIAPLIGAQPSEVIACDSISVNLTKVLCAALQIQQQKSQSRRLVISQKDNFPTDLYMVQGLSDILGQSRCELVSVEPEAILESIEEFGDSAAVLLLTHVNFRSGFIHDMQLITQAAHEKGVLVIWDLAHSAGALDLHLDACEVDFAVGCTYKYLNGGPGAPAFIYAAQKHIGNIKQPVSGWMGHKRPFEFTHDYEAGDGMQSFLAGTPAVISMSILDAALDIFSGIKPAQIRQKSISLTQFFQDAFSQYLSEQDFTLVSPTDTAIRGSQLAYAHDQSYAICQTLIDNKVIADFRAPNILRIGFSPLFLSHVDLLDAVTRIKQVMEDKTYMQAQYQVKHAVT
ncbi:kynureninase [Glaciecola sp. XM2]|uniref:kynureninase n=1 Tax=Glaciecola sp. XM2 TaxID=1914931 RepID=UPI001BDF3E51|nr:kynureninase [Glaciecola sp. XM2]MBT1450598.1 kynureninase [Glaciecola sp. XM2]